MVCAQSAARPPSFLSLVYAICLFQTAFSGFLEELKLVVCGELTMCVLNIMKVIHHASSDEGNGSALGGLIKWIIPFLGLNFAQGSTTAENGKGFTRRATPAVCPSVFKGCPSSNCHPLFCVINRKSTTRFFTFCIIFAL